MCKTGNTITAGWTIRRNDITFNENVDIKLKSTFNTTNPKNPREKLGYLEESNLISFLKPNLNFLYFSALKQCNSLKKSFLNKTGLPKNIKILD